MKILSPAKINLFLQVTGKRPDGYHELFSLMCCVSLFDTILLQFDGNLIEIDSDHPQIPLDETNLAHKAAALFYRKLQTERGLKITIEKSIPVAAGLGGGSSNAASVLQGLNCYYDFPFSREQLISMGRRLGADVPFFLFEKPALVSGIGEKLEVYGDLPPYHVILIYPGFGVSTAEVFQNLNLGLTNCKKKFKKFSFRKTGYDVSRHLCNDLEAVTASRHPVITSVKEQLLKHGAEGALMSGSGPTVFGLFSEQDKAAEALQALGRHTRWKSYLVEIINERNFVNF
jgi:4-diphosphocytidyl-2-C-methyl-D-erythritol kinase